MLGGSQASKMMNKSKTTVRPNQKRKTLSDILSINREKKKEPEELDLSKCDLSFDKISDDVEMIVNEFVGCVGYIYPEGYVTDHGDLEHLVKKEPEPEPSPVKQVPVETPTKQKPMMKVTPAPIMNIDYMQILKEIEEKKEAKEAKKLKRKKKQEKQRELEERQLKALKEKMSKGAEKELEAIKITPKKTISEFYKASPSSSNKPLAESPSTSGEVKKRGRGRPKKSETVPKQIQLQVGDSLMMCDVEDGKEPSSQSDSESENSSEEETQYKPEDVSLKKKRGRPSKKQVPIQIGDNVMLCDVDEGEQEVAELDEVRAVVNEDQEMEEDGEFEPKVKVEKLDTCEYLEPDCIDCKMCEARFGSAALLRSHVRSEHLGIPLEKDLPLDTPDDLVEEEEDEEVYKEEDEDEDEGDEDEEEEGVSYVEEEEPIEEGEELPESPVKPKKKKEKKEKKPKKEGDMRGAKPGVKRGPYKKRPRSEGEAPEEKPKKRKIKSEKVLGKELKKQKLAEARLAAEANGEDPDSVIEDVLNSTLEDSMIDGEEPGRKLTKEEKKERRKSGITGQTRKVFPAFTVPEECAKAKAVFDDQGVVKAFICHFCERTIKVNRQGGYMAVYKEHIKTHTQEKEFKCPLCDYESHRERELRKHVSRHHTEVDAEEVVPRKSLVNRPLASASGNWVKPLHSITLSQEEIDAQEERFIAETLKADTLKAEARPSQSAEDEDQDVEDGDSQEEEEEVEEEGVNEDDSQDELNDSIEYPPEGQEFKVEEDGSIVKEEVKGELIEEAMTEEEEEDEEVPDELPVFYEETGPAVDLAQAGEEEVEEEEEEDAEDSSQLDSSQTTEQILDSALEPMEDESGVVEAEESVQTTEEMLDSVLDSPAVNGDDTETQSVMEVLNLTSKS